MCIFHFLNKKVKKNLHNEKKALYLQSVSQETVSSKKKTVR